MPRLHILAEKYACEDFQKELFRKMADRYGSVSVRSLAAEVGASQSSLNTKLRHNHTNLDVGELRRIIPVLRPDPGIVLTLVGYSTQDIKKFREGKQC